MVGGHDRIKMATSVIDYVFRELAITYLGRDDLAQVTPDDLRHDAVGSGAEQHKLPKESSDLAQVQPIAVGQSRSAPMAQVSAAPSNPRATLRRAIAADQRSVAKALGYEGDPCGECGALTLVRNGTCMKCNTCGATTGCS
jgi:ribonucleoside-diphosphate reductase alpha chain